MTSNEKQDIISAWNEIEEVLQNFNLNTKGFAETKAVSEARLKEAMELLGLHFTDQEAIDFV